MGQIFLPENLPNLVVGSTTSLTLAATNNGQPTRLNVGGQQFALSSTLTLTTSGTGANGLDTGVLSSTTIQLWYVYAIVNATSFAVALVASQTAPSTGPTMPSGYGTAFKLVGAFYTPGAATVGATVTITGTATSGWVTQANYSMILNGAIPSPTSNQLVWRRVGNNFEFRGVWGKGTATISSATSVTWNTPAGIVIDTASMASTSFRDMFGYSEWVPSGGTNRHALMPIYNNTTSIFFGKEGSGSLLIESDLGSAWEWTGAMSIPVVGWNATLL